MLNLQRREVVALGLAMSIADVSIATSTAQLSDSEVATILFDDLEPDPSTVQRAKLTPFWFESSKERPPVATWPVDRLAYDYAHLGQPLIKGAPFELNWSNLLQYARLAHYELDPGATLLFGLRGCALQSGANSTSFASSHRLVEVVPDHIHPRCLLGVARPLDEKIALFSGSTVPCSELMEKQIKNQGGCNLLPTGFHSYRVGAHTGTKQRGAFRQQQSLWVRRATSVPIYSLTDEGNRWDDVDGQLPWDNIHAAMLSYRKKPPFFSSAGCQVVVGAYTRNDRLPTGPWKEFRRAAGLADLAELGQNSTDASSLDDGKPFRYMLLTGREAALLAQGNEYLRDTLRYGSSGAAVQELQKILIATGADNIAKTEMASGKLGRTTLGALLMWQVKSEQPTTGIISRDVARRIGIASM